MTLPDFIRAMPKVELHVHLEGSIQPETLLQLAARNNIELPATNVAGLRDWYRFRDFPHFIEIYIAICRCICAPDDLELITREFLRDRAAQNIRYSEVTFTPYTHFAFNQHIPFDQQLAAINRARAWGQRELGVTISLIPDIARSVQPYEHSLLVADWAISGMNDGIVALGLGGMENGHPPEHFEAAFAKACAVGLHSAPHAGEAAGPESVWGALNVLHAERIGHGVRAIEDERLVEHLRATQTPLEVCPTSNLCTGIYASLGEHPLPRLLAAGLNVTINSDDPPMFNTTLTDEYLRCAEAFAWDESVLEQLVLNAVRATFLPAEQRVQMEADFRARFAALRGAEQATEPKTENAQDAK